MPAGSDLMRTPGSNTLETREWTVVDQKLPVPFPLNGNVLENNRNWIPSLDTLTEDFGGVRRFGRFRAYHDSGSFNEAETISDSRLIGRSVWNTQWLLIIPGSTFVSDPDEGLDTFIYGKKLTNGQRDGNGITDIKVFFQTYAYPSN